MVWVFGWLINRKILIVKEFCNVWPVKQVINLFMTVCLILFLIVIRLIIVNYPILCRVAVNALKVILLMTSVNVKKLILSVPKTLSPPPSPTPTSKNAYQ